MKHDNDDLVTLAALAAQSVTELAGIEDNRVMVEEDFLGRFHAAIAEGLVVDEVPTANELVDRWVLGQLRKMSDNRQKQMKRMYGEHQQTLDLGTDFDSVVTVCSRKTLGPDATAGRITTLGLLTADDLVLMGAESASNRRDVVAADQKVQAANQVWVPTLRRYADYRQYSLARIARSA